jgi:hypothetical protein
MDNVTFIDATNPITGEITTSAIIAHADGSFTSMLKATYDAQQAAQVAPQA